MARHLQNGERFPQIRMEAVGDGPLALPEDLAGSYGVVLVYRGHWCPFCNEQLAAFAGAAETLAQQGIRVMAFSVDDEATTRDLVAKHRLPFKVGHSAKVGEIVEATSAYDARFPTRGHFLENTGFVLAPDGTVVNAVYSSRAIGRLVPSDVSRLVAFMRSIAR